MTSERSIERIDRDLAVERGILALEMRSGRKSSGWVITWRHIDLLLDERLERMPAPDAVPHSAGA